MSMKILLLSVLVINTMSEARNFNSASGSYHRMLFYHRNDGPSHSQTMYRACEKPP
jgi:hypothetical protein